MKLSTKSRYGLRVMLELAEHFEKKLMQVKEISQAEDLPEKYVEQIIITLRTANLIKSVRGARGGYYLARNPNEITVLEVVETLEGPLTLVDCVENPKLCGRSKECMTIDIWKDVGGEIKRILGAKSLTNVLEDHENKKKMNMYHI